MKSRSRTVPTPFLLILLSLGAPLWLAHLVVPLGWLAAPVFWGVLGLLAWRQHLVLPTASDLEASRRLPKRFSLDSRQTIGVRLRNLSGQEVLLRLVDQPPLALESSSPPRDGRLSPGETADVDYGVRPVQRGDHAFDELLLFLRLPGAALLERRLAFDLEERCKVYPQFLQVAEYELLAKIDEREEVVRRPRRIRGGGTDFESLRQYVPGDDLRKVDWKASARRGRLISRVFQVERGQQIAVLVDCGRLMGGQIGDFARIEHAFNAAVMVAYVAQKRGDAVAVATFSNRIESFMPPTRGHLIMPSVLESIYRVRLREVESDYWQVIAESMALLQRRSLVLVMTDVLDSVSSAGLIANLIRASSKHLVLCVVLSEPRVEEVADSVPQNDEDAYRKAAAAHLRIEREIALERLRSRGILVLETDPRHLSIQLVRKYLEIRQADLI
ncbi:MAG TPA: DUF58 domain-containing protein [Acidobacteriota bacterium]|nr:DUF58 domain-containing protein [Acidobacteriota bacterium]